MCHETIISAMCPVILTDGKTHSDSKEIRKKFPVDVFVHITRRIEVHREKGMNEVIKGILDSEIRRNRDYVRGVDRDESFDRAAASFLLGLRTGDSNLTCLALGVVNSCHRERKAEEGSFEWMMIRYTSFYRVVRLIESGITFGRCELSSLFNPFTGTPGETASVYRKNGEGLEALIYGVALFLLSLKQEKGKDDERVLHFMEDYLLQWLDELIDLTACFHEEEGFSGEICDLAFALIAYPQLLPSLERLVRLSGEAIEKEEREMNFLLNAAVEQDREDAFFLLLSVPGMTTDKIDTYPERSMKILDFLLQKNILPPGGEKGEKALRDLIAYRSPSKEVLERIVSPSALDTTDFFHIPLIEETVANKVFDPSLYPLLIKKRDDLSLSSYSSFRLTPLCAASSSGRKEAVDGLLMCGADIYEEDEMGNNVFHYVIGTGKYRNLCDVIKVSPPELLLKKNMYGSSPLDYLPPPEEKDFPRLTVEEAFKDGGRILVAGPGTCGYNGFRKLIGRICALSGRDTVVAGDLSTLSGVLEKNREGVVLVDAVSLFKGERNETLRILSLLHSKEDISVVEGVYHLFAPVFKPLLLSGLETRLILPQTTAFGYEYALGERISVKLKNTEALLREKGEFFIVDIGKLYELKGNGA